MKQKVQGPLALKETLTFDLVVKTLPENPEHNTIAAAANELYLYTTIDGLTTWYPIIRSKRDVLTASSVIVDDAVSFTDTSIMFGETILDYIKIASLDNVFTKEQTTAAINASNNSTEIAELTLRVGGTETRVVSIELNMAQLQSDITTNRNNITANLATLNAAIVRIGTLETSMLNKQPLDATLTALSSVTTAADRLIYATGPDAFSTTPLSSFIRTLLDDINASSALNTLGGVSSTLLGANNGVATLDVTGKVLTTQLPSYVDDVVEGDNLAAFPPVGERSKIYVALDTNKTYRWSGSAYVFITSGAVDSVAGKTGVVSLVKADVGLNLVDNTADGNKVVASAGKLTTPRSIAGVMFDGTANIALPFTNLSGKPTTLAGYGITDDIGAMAKNSLLAYGIGGAAANTLTNIDDNTIPTGFYYITPSMLGVKPTGDDGFGHLIVSRESNGTTARQLYLNNNASNEIWTRVYYPSAWGAWARLVDDAYLDATSAPFKKASVLPISASITLPVTAIGQVYQTQAPGCIITLPDSTTVPMGKCITVMNAFAGTVLKGNGTQNIVNLLGAGTTYTMVIGQVVTLMASGASGWYIVSACSDPTGNYKLLSGIPITANKTLGLLDVDQWYTFNAPNTTLVLPDATLVAFGRVITVVGSANAGTISAIAAQTIKTLDGTSVLSFVLGLKSAVTLVSNGSNGWYVISLSDISIKTDLAALTTKVTGIEVNVNAGIMYKNAAGVGVTTNKTLTGNDLGTWQQFQAAGKTLILPDATTVTAGKIVTFDGGLTGGTIQATTGQNIQNTGINTAPTLVIPPNTIVTVVANSVLGWYVISYSTPNLEARVKAIEAFLETYV